MIGKFLNICEDSCTAAVFGHLLHLPVEMFWGIVSRACFSDSLPTNPGEIEDRCFWPSWDAEGTSNTQRVVPDLFIRFSAFDLIVEAKRWDRFMQSRDQWEDQIRSYSNEYGEDNRSLVMIALGGVWGTQDYSVPINSMDGSEPDRQCPVHMCTWERFLTECKRASNEIAQLRYPSSQALAHGRILADVIELLARHGFVAGQWFRDFDFSPHLLSSATAGAQERLRTGSATFRKL